MLPPSVQIICADKAGKVIQGAFETAIPRMYSVSVEMEVKETSQAALRTVPITIEL